MKTVLVTAIGSFAADIVIKKMQEEGYTVIGCDIYQKEWLVDAYHVDFFYQAPLVSDAEAYQNFILKLCQEHRVEYIFPLTDIEVDFYNKNREVFEKSGITVCISSTEAIDICRNKMRLNQYLKKNNICSVIPTAMLQEVKIQELDYPAVVKPTNGRSSQGLFYIESAEQMENFVRNQDISNYIVQPKISGGIITVDVVRNQETQTTQCVARKELLRTLNGAGTTVYVFHDSVLEKQCRELAAVLGVNGCVNFEFIETDSGEHFFMECNPRFSGGVEFSCIAGYDCVRNHLRCFTGEEIEGKEDLKNQYIARKYEEYVTKIE